MLVEMKRYLGRSLRNAQRSKPEGVGHIFTHDVRGRLPHLKLKVIFDVGAHIGMTALEYSDAFPEATVFAFEPHPVNFDHMRANLIGKPEVRMIQLGLSAEIGKLPFHYNPEHPSMARIASNGETVTDTVAISTVDLFCGEHGITNIDFMKIDVEGHELQVLAGAAKMLERRAISMIRLETAIDPDVPYHTQLWDLCEVLHPYGYRIFGIYDQYEYTLESGNAKLRRFDVVVISPSIQSRAP